MYRTLCLIFALVLTTLISCLPALAQQPGTEIVVTIDSDPFLPPLPGQPVPCTLRDAIEAANTNKVVGGCPAGQDPKYVSSNPLIIDGIDRIWFEFDSGGPGIDLRSALPTITEAVLIDGALASGERVVLSGVGILQPTFSPPVHGLVVTGSNTTLKDLVIQNFTGHGILLTEMDESGSPLPSPFDPPDFDEDPPLGDPLPDPCDPESYPNPDEPCAPPGGGGGPDLPPILPGGSGGHTIVGCRIGTDADGTNSAPNELAGVAVITNGNRVGGETEEEGNLISGNQADGVVVSGHNNTVLGNRIGTDVDGNPALPNAGAGVRLAGGQFGAALYLLENTIHFNDGDGVRVHSGQLFATTNSVEENAELGIDLSTDGPTPSDPGVPQAPELTGWTLEVFGPGKICGQLPSPSSGTVVVEFFQSPDCDPSGFGEGRQPLGSVSVAPGVPGFQFQLPAFANGLITAIATYAAAGTSEFSECLDGPSLAAKCPPVEISL